MKIVLVGFVMSVASCLAGPIPTSKPHRNPPPPIVSVPTTVSATDTPSLAGTTAHTYQQQPITSRTPLVTPEQARTIIDRFKNGYPSLAAPRMLIYVNRELVNESSGLRMTGRKEKVETFRTDLTSTSPSPSSPLGQNVTIVGNASVDQAAIPLKGTSERITGENHYQHSASTNAPLSDRQSVRDVERLMGRPLRLGGARIADQRIATQLLADRSVLGTSSTIEAAKDREALMRTTDVVVEVLISSRSLLIPGISGDQVHQVPEIQATAIRLSDAQILGQASSADIVGPDQLAGRIVRNHDVREITEAVALA
jgi:hypothetical protein